MFNPVKYLYCGEDTVQSWEPWQEAEQGPRVLEFGGAKEEGASPGGELSWERVLPLTNIWGHRTLEFFLVFIFRTLNLLIKTV